MQLLALQLTALEPVIVLFGPPGVGKGTLSQHLKDHYGFEQVSSGDLVRREIDQQTEIGKRIKEIVKSGNYIDKPTMHEMMRNEITRLNDSGSPFLIDGFVRSESDLYFLTDLIHSLNIDSKTFILFLEADAEESKNRIMHRLVCPHCNHVFNEETAKPKAEGKCDACGSDLKIRINDTAAVIEKRIQDYREVSEKIYPQAKKIYPYLCYDTGKPLSTCLDEYSHFIEYVLNDVTTADEINSEKAREFFLTH